MCWRPTSVLVHHGSCHFGISRLCSCACMHVPTAQPYNTSADHSQCMRCSCNSTMLAGQLPLCQTGVARHAASDRFDRHAWMASWGGSSYRHSRGVALRLMWFICTPVGSRWAGRVANDNGPGWPTCIRHVSKLPHSPGFAYCTMCHGHACSLPPGNVNVEAAWGLFCNVCQM